ncbi:hypothetical protein MSAN_01522900 [Mycena sanguinolenta]|uniref:Uncharacterized protein n=1 Tax=Mycena sanguinolenta TaxID=230812 RepID=A0A8H6Y7K2_9AGAR|nr:hypothetical protein MSAN_01522900 [Mycena sanguinolenta]
MSDSSSTNRDSKFLSQRARRAIEPEDWTRFHEYAPRIKFFSTSGFGYEVGAQDTWLPVFEVLSAAIETPHIFPNLQTLWWLVAGPWFPYARLFLCPRMKSLVLGHLKTPAHFALLPTLPRWCPLLTSVTLRTAQQLYMNCRPCSLMVCRMAFLEKLDVDNIDQNAFEHISQLETLKSLAVKRAPDFTPSRPAADVHRFPNLRELTLSKVSLEFLTAFIEMNEFWSFERLDAYMTSTPIAAETARLYALIGTKCDPTTLTTLTLRASSTRGSLSVDLLARGIVTFDAICPLLRMKSLQQVSLAPPGGFSLDDSGIEAVARAWPDILTLDLPGSEYRGPPPRVTLSGIRAFARHCPRLVVLSTPFDASVVPDEDVVLPHEALRLLIVEDAVLVDPAVVAEYLGAMFPKLEAIGTAIRREVVEDVRERADRLHALWKEVGLAPARVTATAVKITA